MIRIPQEMEVKIERCGLRPALGGYTSLYCLIQDHLTANPTGQKWREITADQLRKQATSCRVDKAFFQTHPEVKCRLGLKGIL